MKFSKLHKTFQNVKPQNAAKMETFRSKAPSSKNIEFTCSLAGNLVLQANVATSQKLKKFPARAHGN